MIVLDASVVLKWLFPEENGETRFLEEHLSGENPVAVPELFFYEVSNVLATKTSLPLGSVRQGLDFLADLELETYSFGREEYHLAAEMARRYGISAYDAAYIALAQRLGCPFFTADRKLFRKIKVLPFVKEK